MAEVLSGVNGNIIRWAREFYNMTPDEAAKSIGITSEKLLDWEEGKDYPTYAKLRKLSEVYRKPSAIFFFPEPPHLSPLKGDLRTLSNEVVDGFSKNVIIQFEKAKVYQMSLAELYGDKQCILSNREDFPTDLNELCDYVRNLVDFPINAQKARKSTKIVFEIFRERLYDLGIYVFKESFRDNSISGLCLNDEKYPVIIINNSMSFARQIFTLFHELYHLIIGTSGAEIIRDDFYNLLDQSQSDLEKKCDRFANAFLIPHDDFIVELAKLPLDEKRIEQLAGIYSVSREAIMYTLLLLGKITSSDYTALKETFYGEAIRNAPKQNDEKKNRGNYYATKLSYLGQKYTGDVFKLYFSGKIDSVKTSEMLQSKVNQLPKLETAFFKGVAK